MCDDARLRIISRRCGAGARATKPLSSLPGLPGARVGAVEIARQANIFREASGRRRGVVLRKRCVAKDPRARRCLGGRTAASPLTLQLARESRAQPRSLHKIFQLCSPLPCCHLCPVLRRNSRCRPNARAANTTRLRPSPRTLARATLRAPLGPRHVASRDLPKIPAPPRSPRAARFRQSVHTPALRTHGASCATQNSIDKNDHPPNCAKEPWQAVGTAAAGR